MCKNLISLSNSKTFNLGREYKHQNRHKLCYCCDTLQESTDDIHTLGVSCRGYGSAFDENSFEIQLCPNCYKKEYEKWFNESPTMNGYIEEYQFEQNITDLINSFPIENQEYVWNGSSGYLMERQDWIDMKNGNLPDEKYKEYMMYSPSEIKAYEERFSTCQNVVNKLYSDGSVGCWCAFEAFGDKGQVASENISDECCYCEYYKQRETPIIDIKDEDFDDYKLYIQSKLKMDELDKKFGNL